MFIEMTAVMAPRHWYQNQLGRCSEPLWPLSLKSSLLSPQSHSGLSPGFPSRHSNNSKISVSITGYQYVIRGLTDTISTWKHITMLYIVLYVSLVRCYTSRWEELCLKLVIINSSLSVIRIIMLLRSYQIYIGTLQTRCDLKGWRNPN